MEKGRNGRSELLRSLSPWVILAAGNVPGSYSLASRLSSSCYHNVASGTAFLGTCVFANTKYQTNFFQVNKFKLITEV